MAANIKFDTPIQSGDQSFDRVLNAGVPVAVLFWGGAKLDPDLEAELNARARADAGKLLAVKIKTDDNPDLVRRYTIRTPPTLITFREGRELTRVENPTGSALGEHIEYLLGHGTRPPVVNPSTQGGTVREMPKADSRQPGYGKPVTVTDGTFAREVLQSSLPVVVDFWAAWCGPCRMVAPVLEKIAADYSGRLRVAKLNVDENPRTGEQYQVRGIPTLLLVKNGRIVDRVVGALPEPQIRMRVEQLLRA